MFFKSLQRIQEKTTKELGSECLLPMKVVGFYKVFLFFYLIHNSCLVILFLKQQKTERGLGFVASYIFLLCIVYMIYI